MGIQNLLPFLANSTRDAHISEFENEFVAIDAYCWLHKGIYSCGFELAKKKPTKKYVTYCMRYIEMLIHFNVKPILVFDGRHLSSKSETEKKRREERKKKYERGKELMRAGKTIEGRKLLGESVDVTHELALNLMKECRLKNIDCIVAPYEADAQLAFFSLRNVVKCIITEDSDLLAYGCERVMFKMDTSGRGKLIEKNKIHFSLNITPEEFNEDIFCYMCILTGCDYLPSLPSIGPAFALKFIKMLKDSDIYNALPKLPIYVNKMNVKVTPEYILGFKKALNTFKHQLVYDPFLRSQVPLRPAENDDDIVGTKLPDDLAFQLAVGNIDPITMKTVDNFDPDETGTGFNIFWRTDLLPKAVPKQSFDNPYQPVSYPSLLANSDTKKRPREYVELDTVQSTTNDLKKQRTLFHTNHFRKKNSVQKVPESGFIFNPKILNENKNVSKVVDESKLLKSRYFSMEKSKTREKKDLENLNGKRKDESYEDYLQRLYNEYFPVGENEDKSNALTKHCYCGMQIESASLGNICSICRKCYECCSCDENTEISESQKLNDCTVRNMEELKKGRQKSQHFLLDELYKAEFETLENKDLTKECDEEREDKEKEDESSKMSPSQNLRVNFTDILSKFDSLETENSTTEAFEKENVKVVSEKDGEFERSPSPVFKIRRENKVLNKNFSLGNISDTAGSPTSIYFSSVISGDLNESNPQMSKFTPFVSHRTMSKTKSCNSVPAKSGKNLVKNSSVNRTLFEFGFKKQSFVILLLMFCAKSAYHVYPFLPQFDVKNSPSSLMMGL